MELFGNPFFRGNVWKWAIKGHPNQAHLCLDLVVC
jgi:hypothetical protein